MLISLPRIGRISGSGSRTRSRPNSAMRPDSIRADEASSRMIDSDVTLLPGAALADDPQRPPRLNAKRHAVDGAHDAFFRVEVGLQIGNVDDGLSHRFNDVNHDDTTDTTQEDFTAY